MATCSSIISTLLGAPQAIGVGHGRYESYQSRHVGLSQLVSKPKFSQFLWNADVSVQQNTIKTFWHPVFTDVVGLIFDGINQLCAIISYFSTALVHIRALRGLGVNDFSNASSQKFGEFEQNSSDDLTAVRRVFETRSLTHISCDFGAALLGGLKPILARLLTAPSLTMTCKRAAFVSLCGNKDS